MKLTLLTSLFLTYFIAFIGHSQKCEPYFPMREGVEFEITSFDKNDKFTGKSKHKVVSKTSSGNTMECEIHMESYDQNDKPVTSNDYKVYCKNGTFEFDMNMLMDKEELSAYESMDLTVDADFIEIPSHPEVGETLNDGKMDVHIESNGVHMMTMTISVYNRVVEALETITTPAGTFDCVKVSFDTETKLLLKVKGSVIEWYCKDVGMVKSESYNKKGKLIGSSLLTDIN